MKITEFEETIKKFSEIQNYAPFVTFFFINGSHFTLRTFKQYVVKHSSGNENVAIFSFGINRGGVERKAITTESQMIDINFSDLKSINTYLFMLIVKNAAGYYAQRTKSQIVSIFGKNFWICEGKKSDFPR